MTERIKSKYNSFTSWQNPWHLHCFDPAYTQSLLRFIPAVTGLQCQPKYCHIWDISERDHALWPRGKWMVKKPTLRCLSSVLFYCFFPPFPILHGLSDSLSAYWASSPSSLYVGSQGSSSPFFCLFSSAISPSWSHLLLKPVIHPSSQRSPNPKLQDQHNPSPRTPAPTTGVELCMVHFSEKEDSPWPT